MNSSLKIRTTSNKAKMTLKYHLTMVTKMKMMTILYMIHRQELMIKILLLVFC